MNPYIALALGLPAAFMAGVLYHKHVISEAQAVKSHVTQAVAVMEARLRSQFEDVVKQLAKAGKLPL